MSARLFEKRLSLRRSPFGVRRVLLIATSLVALWASPAAADDAIVRPHRVYQHISGFGASSAWTAQTISESDADLLFSVDKGAGLSLLRVRISPEGTTWETSTAVLAQARGAAVWATPWSPPAEWKSNANVNFGGKLLPEHADDWAARLASFVKNTQTAGVNLFALSAQNEPTTGSVDGASCTGGNNCINYEACRYTAAELGEFIGDHLKPALSAVGSNVQLMGPETQGWTDFNNYWSVFDSNSGSAVDVVATHDYNGFPAVYPEIAQSGRELWQTEVYDRDRTPDPGIESALRVASTISDALVYGNVSAWLYWWIMPNGDDNAGLFTHGTALPTKRLYALGNFSRYLRPGYFRIGLDLQPPEGFSLSAYVDGAQEAAARKLVLVGVNQNDAAVTLKLRFDGYTTGSWQAVVTSDAQNLEPGAPIPDNAGGDFEYSFAPKSITSLLGTTTGTGPSIARPSSDHALPPEDGGCACRAAGPGSAPGGLAALGMLALACAVALRRRVAGVRV